VEELTALRDKSRFDFAYLIEIEGWLKFIYSGDWEHNARLNFVRSFYYRDWKLKATNSDKLKDKTYKKGQFKLL